MRTVVKHTIRVAVVPVLVLLYLGSGVPLLMRQYLHMVVFGMDWLFDRVACGVGYDPSCWPLPAASDEPLPLYRMEKDGPPGIGIRIASKLAIYGFASFGLVVGVATLFMIFSGK